MRFTKYHGLGNDFVFIEDFAEEMLAQAPQLAKRMCDRHFGVGADGLVLITRPSGRYTMRVFNADGSEAEMCGNAIRCVAKHLRDRRLVDGDSLGVGTKESVKTIQFDEDSYTVDMGKPIWDAEAIPMEGSGDSIRKMVTVEGHVLEISGVSLGNPHGVVMVDCVDKVPLHTLGPLLERHPLFPERVNVEFVQRVSHDHLQVAVWERGVGPTLACGTGACASVAVAARLGLVDRSCRVSLPGGDLSIEWREDDHLLMRGPAVRVFTGVWEGPIDKGAR